MTMTESEICVSYRQAKNKNEQVKILADLNLCKPEDITELLARNGYITGTPQVKKQEEKKMPSKGRILQLSLNGISGWQI